MSRKLWTSALWMVAVSGTWFLAPGRCAAQQPTAPASPTSAPAASAVPDAALVLNDPRAPQAQRDEAARRLLSRHTPESRDALRNALIQQNSNGQLAVARALEEDPDPDPSFITPLFPLLTQRSTAEHAGRALAGYKADAQVLTRLMEFAANRRIAEYTRVAAIRAIGTIPERRAAGELMDVLVSPDEPANIHAVAADALINMTGMDQNGQDPKRWMQWWTNWRNKPDADFREAMSTRQVQRLDRLEVRHRNLVAELEILLRDEYQAAKENREALVLRFLNSPEPDVRQIGAAIVRDAFLETATVTPAEVQRLRDMISDSSPAVRRAVADAISKINDPGSLDMLLAQLKTEPDPTVRAALAKALGPIHDLRAVDTLLKLLSDDSLPTAREAAGALGELAQHGPLASNPELARKAAEELKAVVLKRAGTPGAEDLRAACIRALAPLKQKDLVSELLSNKLLDPLREPSPAVRRAMLETVAEINDKNFADLIAESLNDPDASVRLQAIESLSLNPNAPEFVDRVGKMLDPANERDDSVREAAWKFLQGIFPRLRAEQLQGWADRLKNQHERRVLALEALADKQTAAKAQEDLAMTRYQIGDDYMKMKQYGDAAASFKAAMEIFNNLPVRPGSQTTRDALVSDYMRSLLDGAKYTEAVAFAADRIRADIAEQSRMGPIIALKVEQLAASESTTDLGGAKQLIDLVKIMSPPLDARYRGRLDDVEKDLQKRAPATSASRPAATVGPGR